jgi:hypothetical protein
MRNPDTDEILAVVQEVEVEKAGMGWTMVARESEILPFNTPRFIVDGAYDGFWYGDIA